MIEREVRESTRDGVAPVPLGLRSLCLTRRMLFLAFLFTTELIVLSIWLAGTLAGILYGMAVIRSGRIGEAIVAHATTNALWVAYILAFDKWHLW